MTEAEWLTSNDPLSVWETTVPSDSRRVRLFGCACLRAVWRLPANNQTELLDTVERYADGGATDDELATVRQSAVEALIMRAVYGSHASPPDRALLLLDAVADVDECARVFAALTGERERLVIEDQHRAPICNFLRDIFGNPFRPVAFDPAWRTDTAVAVARQMYDSREFGAMPILADALQDAGCESDEVLNHCRDPHAVHVRGCWVCDLVLGKV